MVELSIEAYLADDGADFEVALGHQLEQISGHEHGIVVVRVEQGHLDVDRGRAVVWLDHARSLLHGQDLHLQGRRLLSVEDALVLDGEPARGGVHREGPGRVHQLVGELAVVALVTVVGYHLQ